MARKQHHEEHANHEAWAIPYGDLITLLLAFFVVMYAVSSVNEGKYRVLSDSLQSAFAGAPRSMSPIQTGDQVMRAPQDGAMSGMDPMQAQALEEQRELEAGLAEMATSLEEALKQEIDEDVVAINRESRWVEIEIKTDILFPSGSAEIESEANELLAQLARTLAPLPNKLRVEGYTDTRPINTSRYPSNWELSAARAARIVRQFESLGVEPARMVVAGLGEHQPVADNASPEGRRRNRRVALLVLDSRTSEPGNERASLSAAVQADRLPPAGEEVIK